ncbi:MAG: signal peptidase I [Thermoproteota archaeon]
MNKRMVSIKLPGLSRRNLIRFTGCFLLILFMFLALARFIDFPVSMFMVAGRSMEPTLYMGDLVFSFKGDYIVGDIVIVEGVNRVNCIIHRVVDMTERYVTTKGDANPGPDNPIDKNSVLYKVVFVVSRLLWLPPVLAVSLFLGYRYLKSLLHGAEVGRTLITLVTFFSILDIAFMALIPIFHVHQSIPLNKPSIQLKSISLSSDFKFFRAVYGSINLLNFVKVDEVTVSAAGKIFTPESFSMEEDTLVVSVPQEVYETLYANSSDTSSFWVYCTLVFDKATLHGYYPVTFSWRRFDVNVVNDTMVVSNPNPVPINASFEIQYFDLDRFGRLYHVHTDMFDGVIRPVSNFTVKPDRIGVTSRIITRYMLLNQSIVESKEVIIVSG